MRATEPLLRPADLVTGILGEGRTVLDLPCEDGRTAAALREAGHRVVGVGRSRRRVRRLAARSNGRAIHRVGHAYRLPVSDASVDALLARHLLPRLARPHEALAEWLRVLRPDGRLLVVGSFPAPSPPSLLRRLLPRSRGGEPMLEAPDHPSSPSAPFRTGLRAAEVRTFLELADVWDVRCYDLPRGHYLVHGRKP